MSNVLHITTGAFPKVAELTQPALLDFWAPWCGPCRAPGPIFDQVADSIGDRAVLGKINVDEEPQLAAVFGVSSIPTLIVMKQGKAVKRMVGVQQAGMLTAALEAAGA